ncbi:MAG: outer membrane protein assembly factor BamD [Deltaproteobacteria bacterium]|nr:outer membrane protein assembly factor BamD [Deltaproteobacteria bacterium]
MKNIIFKTSLIILLLFTASCSSSKKRASSQLDYSKSAMILYEEGVYAFEKERWGEAEKIFMDVGRLYPYSKFAPISELRVADCHFNLGSHPEAAVEYQHFLKTYPTHELAHYAAFKKAESYYEQIPSQWFLTPPTYEKDQTATRDARSAFASFIKRYPDSEYVKEAKELYTEVEDALVQHEMYVASFYLKREKRKAAAVRLESIGKQFPGSDLVPDAMFLQAITLLEMGKKEDALMLFGYIKTLYPGHPQAMRAKKYLRAFNLNLQTGEVKDGQ